MRRATPNSFPGANRNSIPRVNRHWLLCFCRHQQKKANKITALPFEVNHLIDGFLGDIPRLMPAKMVPTAMSPILVALITCRACGELPHSSFWGTWPGGLREALTINPLRTFDEQEATNMATQILKVLQDWQRPEKSARFTN